METGSVRSGVAGAALLALMIYNGAFHAVPMAVAAIGTFALIATIALRQWRPMLAGGLVILGGFMLSAPKLLPVALWVSSDRFVDARTVLEHPDQMTGEIIAHAYLDRYQHRGLRFGLQRSGWHEYGNYIGTLAAALIVASVLYALMGPGTRKRWLGLSLALTTVLLFALSAGEFSPWAPATLGAHVPLFGNFRIPSRYTIVCVLAGIATVGWAVQAIEADTAAGPGARLFLALILTFGALDVVVTNRAHLARVFSVAPLDRGFVVSRGVSTLEVDRTSSAYTPDSPMLRSLMRNRAFFACYESLQTKRSATPDGALVESDGKAQIVDFTFSPNRVQFSAVGGRETSVVRLNQNLAAGWRSSVGPVLPDAERGQPSVTLQPGQTGKFSFSFVPPGLAAGVVLLMAAVAGTAAAWRRRLP
jgi:hypothetical protein